MTHRNSLPVSKVMCFIRALAVTLCQAASRLKRNMTAKLQMTHRCHGIDAGQLPALKRWARERGGVDWA